MSGKPRALPSWMKKKKPEVKVKEPLRSTRKPKTARAVFYCLTERELVEAAAACLTSGVREDRTRVTEQQVEDEAGDAAVKTRDNAAAKTISKMATLEEEESSDCSDVPETTYVSETDLDITELETVPYTKSPEGQRSGGAEDHGGLMNVGPEEEEKQERSQKPAEEDDSLRLVREIFFT